MTTRREYDAMIDGAKLKNDKLKPKNDENLGFDDLMDGGYEPENPLIISEKENIGCGAFVGAAMEYPFHGEGSNGKILTAALLTLIPFVGSMTVSGYGVRVVRRVLRNQRDLPEWNDFVGDFVRGLALLLGGGIFALLMGLSMVAVITIPIVIIFGSTMIGYSICRYAETDDFTVFFDILGAYRYVLNNLSVSFMFAVNSILLGLCWGLVITLGYIIANIVGGIFFGILSIDLPFQEFLLNVPGLMLSAAATISFTYMMGAWGHTVGLEA